MASFFAAMRRRQISVRPIARREDSPHPVRPLVSSSTRIPMAKRRLRKVAACFMAHPDDCEFLAAGTMALLARRGWELHIVTCTPGDCGSAELGPEEISRVRRAEAARAAAVIGATYHCLELRDLNITFDRDAISRTVRLARDIAPSLMFTHALQDYMPDHEVAAQLARTASVSWFVPNAAAGPIPPDG